MIQILSILVIISSCPIFENFMTWPAWAAIIVTSRSDTGKLD